MTAITVTNTDWSIVDDVRDALAAAKIASSAVFDSVTVTTCDEQVQANRLSRSPVAIVRYVTTREIACPEDVRGACVCLEIILAAAVDDTDLDESARLAEILRLKNAAVNAIEAEPPAAACAWGSRQAYQPRIGWGQGRIDLSAGEPWAICRLSVEIGFVIPTGTSH
jgi:hypothetical protein